jgi:hypothetical protein
MKNNFQKKEKITIIKNLIVINLLYIGKYFYVDSLNKYVKIIDIFCIKLYNRIAYVNAACYFIYNVFVTSWDYCVTFAAKRRY